MKKRNVLVAMILAASFTMTSCIGSFSTCRALHRWNTNIGSKWLNELVFLGLCIVPVYEVCALADALVFNTMEFWGAGSGPVASTQ